MLWSVRADVFREGPRGDGAVCKARSGAGGDQRCVRTVRELYDFPGRDLLNNLRPGLRVFTHDVFA